MFAQMLKNKYRNIRNKNKEDNMPPQKELNNTLILECEDKRIDEMPENEFKRIIIHLLRNTENKVMRQKFHT